MIVLFSGKIEIRCGALTSTGGAQVKLTGGDVFQALASYSCPANQCLNGDKVRRCQANGKWTGTHGSCVSKSYFLDFIL